MCMCLIFHNNTRSPAWRGGCSRCVVLGRCGPGAAGRPVWSRRRTAPWTGPSSRPPPCTGNHPTMILGYTHEYVLGQTENMVFIVNNINYYIRLSQHTYCLINEVLVGSRTEMNNDNIHIHVTRKAKPVKNYCQKNIREYIVQPTTCECRLIVNIA